MSRLAVTLLSSSFMLAGCMGTRAPSFYLVGSYFPSWLLCAVIGIVGAVLVRVVFIHIGLDDVLPLRLLVYVCLALIIALLTSALFFIR